MAEFERLFFQLSTIVSWSQNVQFQTETHHKV